MSTEVLPSYCLYVEAPFRSCHVSECSMLVMIERTGWIASIELLPFLSNFTLRVRNSSICTHFAIAKLLNWRVSFSLKKPCRVHFRRRVVVVVVVPIQWYLWCAVLYRSCTFTVVCPDPTKNGIRVDKTTKMEWLEYAEPHFTLRWRVLVHVWYFCFAIDPIFSIGSVRYSIVSRIAIYQKSSHSL